MLNRYVQVKPELYVRHLMGHYRMLNRYVQVKPKL
jgi:hypothetical protein